jgi:hypothetical protein
MLASPLRGQALLRPAAPASTEPGRGRERPRPVSARAGWTIPDAGSGERAELDGLRRRRSWLAQGDAAAPAKSRGQVAGAAIPSAALQGSQHLFCHVDPPRIPAVPRQGASAPAFGGVGSGTPRVLGCACGPRQGSLRPLDGRRRGRGSGCARPALPSETCEVACSGSQTGTASPTGGRGHLRPLPPLTTDGVGHGQN